MTIPVLDRDGVTLYQGDCRTIMAELEPESIDCVVTSPPYWGLRDYGIPASTWADGWQGCLGLEPTPAMFVTHILEVMREVRRVLRKDGTVWLNIGDSYVSTATSTGAGGSFEPERAGYTNGKRPSRLGRTTGLKPKDRAMIPARVAIALCDDGWYLRDEIVWSKSNPMPSSVSDRTTPAHEMVYLLTKSARYWYDAAAIAEPVASGPSDIRKMLESQPRMGGLTLAQDDPMLAASGKTNVGRKRAVGGNAAARNGHWPGIGPKHDAARDRDERYEPMATHLTRNKRSVWTIPTEPYPEAHFATFPRRLVVPMILAGCPERRPADVQSDDLELVKTPTGGKRAADPSRVVGRAGYDRPRGADEGTAPITRYEQRAYAAQLKASPHRAEMAAEAGKPFEHYIRTDYPNGARAIPPKLLTRWLAAGWLTAERSPGVGPRATVPGVVLDPFGGSGTVGEVARTLGRRAILIELSEAYIPQAIIRASGGLVDPGEPVIEEEGTLWHTAI